MAGRDDRPATVLHSSLCCLSPARSRGAAAPDGRRLRQHPRLRAPARPGRHRPARRPARPRTPRPAHYIITQLAALGIKAVEQPFDGAHAARPRSRWPTSSRPFPATRPDRIILASHFDTKLFREFRFVGASDGASSTAALLELARVLKDTAARRSPSSCCSSTARKRSSSGAAPTHTYGSRHYVRGGAQGRHAGRRSRR